MAKRKSFIGFNNILLLLIVSVFCIGPIVGQQYPQQYYQQAQAAVGVPNGAQYVSAQQYPSQYQQQQPQAQLQQAVQSVQMEDHHREVDEKDYSVSGGSNWMWFLGMPIIFIPLILLLCTPIFHKQHESPYSYYGGGGGGEHGGHHSSGGWGHKEGWKRSSDNTKVIKDDVTTRVLKGISSTASNISKKPRTKGVKSASGTSTSSSGSGSGVSQQRG